MRLYSGTSVDFIDDSVHNRIADKLKDAYFVTYRREAPPSEVNSWRNSLRAVSQVFDNAGLNDHGVLLEYELPLTSKRLDCLITGRNELLHDNAVIIELKQWDQCEAGDGDRIVTFVGKADRDVLHPSIQVGQYKRSRSREPRKRVSFSRRYLEGEALATRERYEVDALSPLSSASFQRGESFDTDKQFARSEPEHSNVATA
jgi:hypothetical protein